MGAHREEGIWGGTVGQTRSTENHFCPPSPALCKDLLKAWEEIIWACSERSTTQFVIMALHAVVGGGNLVTPFINMMLNKLTGKLPGVSANVHAARGSSADGTVRCSITGPSCCPALPFCWDNIKMIKEAFCKCLRSYTDRLVLDLRFAGCKFLYFTDKAWSNQQSGEGNEMFADRGENQLRRSSVSRYI